MHKLKSNWAILVILLLFAGHSLAGPFLLCEDMRNPEEMTLEDGSHCDGMMPPAKHEHEMHDEMHDEMTAHGHSTAEASNTEASDHTCTHLCSACLASASLAGFHVPDGTHSMADGSPLSRYLLLLPSVPVKLLFRPPIFA